MKLLFSSAPSPQKGT